ncbi:hypothetical protein A2954_07010 [Candidatus Roizmanbacteria bacterium RIFCSPLOWO2_01_FULL_37_12]|uniref:Multidrug resistance protein MdtA-like C-terminal permuted SH3 domain-containing protein n=1 Tax=Candidatus Roizmanbacteria bacterium RIFCSPLOWO2_01_FULL_37_12 TaxID=1802056 RepID=A0A1F7IE20_9BACT|nr:MAG: hypothetical protein A3D76_02315 [Candidatus Roizmanbacteria bacterium RIFCSPHIGHO2_02_FULL_37_9b]OGK41602.1 MAG: hypothetical protein A2954_07010 [Candidatus Roizmanbacteria bacterium RIFCSPLOWO2_01_FULL_37_12]
MANLLKKRWYFFVLVLIILGSIVYQKQTAKIKSEKEKSTYTVKRQTLRDDLSLSGEIDASEKTTLRFQSSGKLTWIGVREGDYVQKFQAIAALDQREVQQNLKKYLNTYVNERLDLDQEKQDTQIKYTGSLSEDARREAIRVLDKAQNDLNNAVIDVELKNLAIEYATLYSPIEGLVVSIGSPYAGVNITPSQAEIEIINPNTIYFSATADQTDVVRLQEGMVGKITFDSYPDDNYGGTLYYVSFTPKEDETGTVYNLKFQLDDRARSLPLKMMMTGDIDLNLSEMKNVIAIPSGFINKDKKGSYVKVDNKGKEEKRYIKIGEVIEGNVVIRSGLSEGEVVYD